MKKLLLIATAAFLCASIANAQIQINLSGTIVNQANYPVKNMLVKLSATGFADTSDSLGKFEVLGQLSSVLSSWEKNKPALNFTGNNFILTVSSSERLSMDVFDLQGKLIAPAIKNEMMASGRHSISITEKIGPLSSAIFIAVIKYGQAVSYFRIVKTGSQNYLVKELAREAGMSGVSSVFSKALALDSLRFIRRGKVEFTIPITKWLDKFEVKLDLIPYEVVEAGLNEWNLNHIWPDLVGTTVSAYPGKLTNYLNRTGTGPHDYEAWCSEFYSWANRVGGYPFGDDLGTAMDPHWMLDTHLKLQSWFQTNNAYVTKAQIATTGYVPVPGDFVHMAEYGGHSGMVWKIVNDTLYTVEGNYVPLNQMKVWSRGSYKIVTTTDPNTPANSNLYGYGRRSGVYGSSYKSIAGR